MDMGHAGSRILIIAGPPCAGKSTLAQRLAVPGDVVLDRDDMARRLGSPKWWMHDYRYGVAAEQWMQRELRRLAWGVTGSAYVVRGLPRVDERRALAERLNADVWLLDPGMNECIRRAIADGRPVGTVDGIRRWYAQAAVTVR
jgi:hypothetical protein